MATPPLEDGGRLRWQAHAGESVGAAVAGCLVAFAPSVSLQHRQDVLDSLLLAQGAASAQADRHAEPGGWFRAFRAVLEQSAWVVESSAGMTRYLPATTRFAACTVVRDVFRLRLAAEGCALVGNLLERFRRDDGGAAQWVFECPSHRGGQGSFLVALAEEDEGVTSLAIAMVSFTTPAPVVRLMLETFDARAQFRWAFLQLLQNEEVFGNLRSTLAAKVQDRIQASVGLIA